jgi:hypothetical protein
MRKDWKFADRPGTMDPMLSLEAAENRKRSSFLLVLGSALERVGRPWGVPQPEYERSGAASNDNDSPDGLVWTR